MRCTISMWCIETSRAQISFLKTMRLQQSLVIWMYQRSQISMDWIIHKQEHHTMLHLKCGTMNHMTIRVMFGAWDVSYTKWPHWSHHFKLKICKDCIKRYWKVNILRYRIIFHKIWTLCLRQWSKLIPSVDWTLKNWRTILYLESDHKNTSLNYMKTMFTNLMELDRVFYLRRLKFLKIYCTFPIVCLKRIIMRSKISNIICLAATMMVIISKDLLIQIKKSLLMEIIDKKITIHWKLNKYNFPKLKAKKVWWNPRF